MRDEIVFLGKKPKHFTIAVSAGQNQRLFITCTLPTLVWTQCSSQKVWGAYNEGKLYTFHFRSLLQLPIHAYPVHVLIVQDFKQTKPHALKKHMQLLMQFLIFVQKQHCFDLC